MKHSAFCFFALLLGSFCQLKAQEDKQAAQKAWMAYMTPGSIHQMLAKGDGEWKCEMTLWMAPDAPPTTSIASSARKMILGGRYQESTFTGSFMGMPFEGLNTVGYDNAKKVFVLTWIDNMGTGIMNMEGTWDADTRSINFIGKAVDPLTGKDMNMREVFKLIDDNTQEMEMYVTMQGKEFKNMDIKFTRK